MIYIGDENMINDAKDLSTDPKERINQVLEIAEEVFSDRPVMAIVATSQAILESALASPNGPSGLALKNNLFGIKGRGTAGDSRENTQESINGRMVTVRDGFAVNATLRDSFMQYRELMYKIRYQDVLNAKTSDEAFEELYEAGYATDPQYPSKLKRVRDQYLRGDK